jgi:agmatinase
MKALPEKLNFLMIEKKYSNIEKSKIVILSAPFEESVSYGKGTKNGPKAILNASHYVEFYDEEFDRELCFDLGIATIKPLNFTKKNTKQSLQLIYESVKYFLNKNKFVVVLGGEHTISISPIKAHFEQYPDMSVLHLDAHSDLRQSYKNDQFSHASAIARVCDFFPKDRLVQVGIRAQCIEESEFIKQNKINFFYAYQIRCGKFGKNWQKNIVEKLSKNIYITFDVDYFDPSLMPSTGTTEPDGFFWNETMDIFREINRQNKIIIGFDVVEFSPNKGIEFPDELVAKLVYKLLNFSFYRF